MRKFDLEFPIEHASSIVRSVLVRAPTADDFEATALGWKYGCACPPEAIPNAIHKMIERLTDLPAQIVLEMDWVDIIGLGDVIGELGREAMKGKE